MNRIDIDTLDCTFEEFLKATDGHFTLNFDKIDAQNQITIANKVQLLYTCTLTFVYVNGYILRKSKSFHFLLYLPYERGDC